jgi:glycosyltransferase involved in cell wall biosynthesis
MTSLVGVTIPYWNAGGTIDRALDSISAQTCRPIRVVVVDDGSDPHHRALLEQAVARPRGIDVDVVHLKHSLGPGAARNIGWRRLEHDVTFVAFLDADDEWAPCKLEVQQRWMTEHPAFSWSAHRCTAATGSAAAAALRRSQETRPVTYRRLRGSWLLVRNTVATPTVMVRADVPVRFRDGWRQCEDLLLWLDLLHHGWAGAMLSAPMCTLGRSPGTPGGLTGDLAGMLQSEQRLARTLRAEGRLSQVGAAAVKGIRWLAWRRRQRRVAAC